MTDITEIEATALRQSIEEIGQEDFAGEWKTDIYLDPESKKLYSFTATGGIPMDAYHKIDRRILTVSPTAIASSVERYLIEIEDELESLIEGYQGSDWNGSNHIGSWSEDALLILEKIAETQIDSISHHSIAHYWDADEWFSPITSDLKSAWQEGKTAEQIIDEQGCGTDDADGMCDRDEAVSWLETKIAEWVEEESEEQ